jgi:hypothetical protein
MPPILNLNTDTSALKNQNWSPPSMDSAPQYKLLLFFKRNPSLSGTEFKVHYETNHVPMVMNIAKDFKGLLHYTRRYLNHDASDPALKNPLTVFGIPVPTIDFDVVAEVTFDSMSSAQEFEKRMYNDEENAKTLLEDENRLFVRSQMRGMLVEEIVSIV